MPARAWARTQTKVSIKQLSSETFGFGKRTTLSFLLAAISLHRVAFGLLLVVAFSAGLALTITGIGLVAVVARSAFRRSSFEGRLVRLLPTASALVILAAGALMTVHALPAIG